MKIKNIATAVAVVVGITIVGGCAGLSTGASTQPSGSTSVGTGLGSKDASGDVSVGTVKNDATLGWASVPVTITNHSTGRSDYFVTIALESADGSTQVDTTLVSALGLEPGQKTVQTAQFTDAAPAGAVVKVTEVQRTASN